jgi:hypothetical protein
LSKLNEYHFDFFSLPLTLYKIDVY